MTTNNVKFQFRRDLAANWNPAYVMRAGEPGYELDTRKLKIGDGHTPWRSLPYLSGSGGGLQATQGPPGLPGVQGPPGNTGPVGTVLVTSYIFDGGNSTSSYVLGPAFDCGSSI
jgi:hypothetical protein